MSSIWTSRQEVTPIVSPTGPAKSVDTVRALCRDLRQPLLVILPLAGAQGGDVQHRLDVISEEAQWLLDMVESVIGGAADLGLPPCSVCRDVKGAPDLGR